MQVQPPLATRFRDALHGLLNGDYIDYATFIVCHLYAEREALEAVLLRDISRNDKAVELIGIRDVAMSQISDPRKLVIVYLGLLRLIGSVINLSEILSSWAFTDSTRGGALEPFKKRIILKPNGDLTPKVKRRLYSQKWIRGYVSRDSEIQHVRFVASRLAPHLDAFGSTEDVHISAELLNLDIDCYNLGRLTSRIDVPAVSTDADRDRRKTFKQSLRLLRSIIAEDEVNRFLGRQAIVVAGSNVDLSLRLRGSIYAEGHGACEVCVLSKVGEPLVDLCVYFEDTPVLDQVVGFVLHMYAGDEEELLCAANLSRVHVAGVRHKLIRPLLKNHTSQQQVWRLRELEYLDDTKLVWQSACLNRVFGAKQAEAMQATILSGATRRALLSDGLSHFT